MARDLSARVLAFLSASFVKLLGKILELVQPPSVTSSISDSAAATPFTGLGWAIFVRFLREMQCVFGAEGGKMPNG